MADLESISKFSDKMSINQFLSESDRINKLGEFCYKC